MDRKKFMKKLGAFNKGLDKKYKVSKMILFGSRVGDEFREDSDVDLIVVGEFSGKGNLERAPPLYLEWKLDLPVDFLCYTLEEFDELKNRVSIVREAVREGVEIL